MLVTLRTALHSSQREDPLLPSLAERLRAFADAVDNAERIDHWVALHDWTRVGAHVHASGDDEGAQLGAADTVRLRLMLHVLESCPEVRQRVQDAVAGVFAQADACSLLAEAGIPSDRGFLGEAAARLWAKVLPEPCDSADLRQFVRRCYRNRRLIARFQRWPPEVFQRIVAVVMPPADAPTWLAVRRSVSDAVHLLCLRVTSQGLAPKLRSRSQTVPVVDSPFFRLPRAADDLLARWNAPPSAAGDDAVASGIALQAWNAELSACRIELAEIDRQIRSEGISVDIVFSLDLLERCLARLELLGAILACPAGPARVALIQRLLQRLVVNLHESRSLRDLAATNLRLLHRRIVERAGETGEHYIAHDRREYAHLLLAAAGGGVLTVGTTALKLLMSEFPGSDFAHGLYYSFNYAVSFLILHHLHLVLATKQPAMTAATLATILREQGGAGRIEGIVDRIARISHSQLAAAAGNVLLVALGALALTTMWRLATGHAFLDQQTAQAAYASLSPVTTGTVFFAALTGIILWLSSLAGGWIDNWSAWHRIHRGIADHRAGGWLGRARLVRWGKSWRRHVGAWGANISLGLMLGMTPALGHFLGLPLDVRHVTLSTGMLFTACGSLADGWYSSSWFLLAGAGIATMFVLNLGVSFALSLWTALRALEIPAADVRQLMRRLGHRVLTRPVDFILPPRAPQAGREP
jgi:site-specific recombinase